MTEERDPRIHPSKGDSVDLTPESRTRLRDLGKPIHRKRQVTAATRNSIRYRLLPVGSGAAEHTISLQQWREETEGATILGRGKVRK